jgi:hypothetical protein
MVLFVTGFERSAHDARNAQRRHRLTPKEMRTTYPCSKNFGHNIAAAETCIRGDEA